MDKCIRNQHQYEYIQFQEYNIADVMKWFGEDFIAMTNGATIVVDGTTVGLEKIDYHNKAAARLVVYRCRGKIAGATLGSVIIRDEIFGYISLSEEMFWKYYRPAPFPDEWTTSTLRDAPSGNMDEVIDAQKDTAVVITKEDPKSGSPFQKYATAVEREDIKKG